MITAGATNVPSGDPEDSQPGGEITGTDRTLPSRNQVMTMFGSAFTPASNGPCILKEYPVSSSGALRVDMLLFWNAGISHATAS